MGPRGGPGTSGTLLHRRAARQPRTSGAIRRTSSDHRRRRGADVPANSSATQLVAGVRIRKWQPVAHRLHWRPVGAARLHPPPGLGSGPVFAGRNRGPIRGDATRPRREAEVRSEQTNEPGTYQAQSARRTRARDDRGSGRRPRAAEGVVHRGPIARCAARACRLPRGEVRHRVAQPASARPENGREPGRIAPGSPLHEDSAAIRTAA